MKKIWIYLLGILTGVILTFVVLGIIGSAIESNIDQDSKNIKGMTLFETPGDVIDETSFKVFQVVGEGMALAQGKGHGESIYMGINALLYNEEGTMYYDEQVITATKGKCFRQVGIFHYTAKSGMEKTVPVVMIMDNK